jgi:glycosyltransferase involved in cell wall biosynthesis
MSLGSPLVSIGMSVRNNQKTLALAIRSIMNQSYTNWELILIDDGSSDQTGPIAQGFAEADGRIRLLSDGLQRGLPERLNQAIAASRGEYFARMDGDDVAYPMRLERQVDYLQRHPEVDLVGASAIIFKAGGVVLGKRPAREHHDGICARFLYRGFGLMHPTFLGRIGFFRTFGYRSAIPYCEDQDICIRSFGKATFSNVVDILLGYREERLEFRKILTTRRYLVKCLFHELWRQGRPVFAILAVAVQYLKLVVDAVAIGSGLNYHILRHRALLTTAAERQQWEQIWADLQDV